VAKPVFPLTTKTHQTKSTRKRKNKKQHPTPTATDPQKIDINKFKTVPGRSQTEQKITATEAGKRPAEHKMPKTEVNKFTGDME